MEFVFENGSPLEVCSSLLRFGIHVMCEWGLDWAKPNSWPWLRKIARVEALLPPPSSGDAGAEFQERKKLTLC